MHSLPIWAAAAAAADHLGVSLVHLKVACVNLIVYWMHLKSVKLNSKVAIQSCSDNQEISKIKDIQTELFHPLTIYPTMMKE